MDERAKSIPTSRLRRTAKLGGLVGSQGARMYATKATNLARSEDGRRAAAERRQLRAAEHILDVLGTMKGAAMKVGQVASFVDTGTLPPEFHARLEAKLAELRDSAPRVSFEDMRKVIEGELDEPLEEVFAEFDETAFAAASIGQVYRARLHDGRRVAVKVQYPGIAQAVRADLQNMGLIMRAAKLFAPAIDAKAMAAEIRERLLDELDYELEAETHRRFARTWRGHPFVFVPDVVTSLSHERVLVSEYVEGIGFDDVKALSQDERDRFGEIVFRFFLGSLYRTRHFSADPHPGNYVLMDDGRVAFLDFGMAKKLTREQVDAEIRVLRAGLERNGEGLRSALAEMGFFDPGDEVVTADRVLAHFEAAAGWFAEDRPFTIDRPYVRQVFITVSDPRSEFFEIMKRQTVPPEAMFARRMETLTLAVLGQHHAVLGGMRLHFLDWGTEGLPAGLPSVLFLHGGGLTARTWDLVCLALRSSAHCFALDQRGHGDSEWSPVLDYGPEAHVSDLEELIRHLRLERPVLVGQSMGALNSLSYAAHHADEIAGLVLVDMTPDVRIEGAERIFDFVTAPAELDSVEEFVERAMHFNPSRDPNLLRRSLMHNLRQLPDGRWTWKYDRRGMTRERFDSMRERVAGLWGLLDSVTCPTLVVRGERSDVVRPESAAALAAALPNGECATVPGAGHTVQGDNPRALAEVLGDFLRRARPPA